MISKNTMLKVSSGKNIYKSGRIGLRNMMIDTCGNMRLLRNGWQQVFLRNRSDNFFIFLVFFIDIALT